MGRAPMPTRASLILRIRDPRDDEAWGAFVDLYGPFIYEMCLRSGLRHSEAADATQNVFVRVLRNIRTFDYRPERGRFRDWLGRLTRNEVAESWEARNRARRDARSDGRPEPRPLRWEDGAWEEAFAAYIQRRALERARGRVSKRTWIIFKLTWFVGCAPERVAARLGLPVARVFEAKCRFLARFREEADALAAEAAALVPIAGPGHSAASPSRADRA